MGQTSSAAMSGIGVGFGANASLRAGAAAKKVGDYNATAITNEADYNSKVAEYNSKVAELQAQDAISRGQVAESTSRAGTSGVVGGLRASFGAQGVNLDVGSPSDVVQSVAAGGALDAMTVRQNAKNEAWGLRVQSQSDLAQAEAIRSKGTVDAWNATNSGNVARASGRNAAIATVIGGAGDLIRQRYGFRNTGVVPAKTKKKFNPE